VLPGVVAPATSAFSQSLEVVTPLRIVALHPCPRLPNGTSLCGHPAGAAQWPLFFVAAGSDAEDTVPDLSDWCWPGHTGRWCAQCRDGFFSSGRLCKRCLPTGLHVLIVVACHRLPNEAAEQQGASGEGARCLLGDGQTVGCRNFALALSGEPRRD
jgi:hypothetical protein